MDDIFLKLIYRNQYLRRLIFNGIKIINKELKYIRYTYYEVSLEFIIKTRNQILLRDKLNDYLKLQNWLKENKSSNGIKSVREVYKYYIDLKQDTFVSLFEWRELDLELFKIIYTSFKPIILNNFYLKTSISTNYQDLIKQIYHNLVFNNGVNVGILDFILKEFIENGGERELKLVINLLWGNENILIYKAKNIVSNISIEMFNYLFNSHHNGVCEIKRIEKVLLEFLVTSICSIDKWRPEITKALFDLFRNSKFDKTQDSLTRLVNRSIEMNNLEVLKQIFSNYQFNEIEEEECYKIEIYGYAISLKTLKGFNIDLMNFTKTENNDKMLPLFKVLIEKVYVEAQYFTINQTTPIVINSPDYFYYAIEMLEKNNVPFNRTYINTLKKDKINFTFKCIETQHSALLQPDMILITYYQSKVFNDNPNIFQEYNLKFQMDKQRLLVAVDLGHKTIVKTALDEMILNLRFINNSNDEVNLIDLKFFIQLLNISLPSDQHDGHQYIFDLILPLINKLKFVKDHLFIYVNNKNLPADPLKRRQYIECTSKIDKFNLNKSIYWLGYLKTYFKKCDPSEEDAILHFLPEILDFNEILYSQNQILMNIILNNCLKLGAFKMAKNIMKFTEIVKLETFFKFISNIGIKQLFFLLLYSKYLKKWASVSEFIENLSKVSQSNFHWFDLAIGLNEFKDFNFLGILSDVYIHDFDNYEFFSSSNNNIIDTDRLLALFQIKFLGDLSCHKRIDIIKKISSTEIIKHNPLNYNWIKDLFLKHEGTYPNSIYIKEYVQLLKHFDLLLFSKYNNIQLQEQIDSDDNNKVQLLPVKDLKEILMKRSTFLKDKRNPNYFLNNKK